MLLTRSEILDYLKRPDSAELFSRAQQVRAKHCGSGVLIRAIIEFSNYCTNNCLYCGLRSQNKYAQRFRLPMSELERSAKNIIGAGIDTIVLQSGDDPHYTPKDICKIIERLKNLKNDIAITLSIGERQDQDYKAFKTAGADRYLIKHETANQELYAKMHPGQSLKRRKEILLKLREYGYQIGSGCIIGLPGQGLEEIADDLEYLGELQPDMAGLSPFLPQKDTPLAATALWPIEITLRAIALARIITENAHLPATTALGSFDSAHGLTNGLKVGANVLMCDYTPDIQSSKYKIYDNKQQITLLRAKKAITAAGLKFAAGRGDSLKSGFR